MKTDLGGKWNVKRLSDGMAFTGYVPGSAMNDMLEAGLTEDPFYRDNEYKAYDLFRTNYEYSRDFDVTGEVASSDRVTLVCEGIDTLADIYINGRKLTSTDNMHRTYRLDLREMIHQGTNTIRILLKSPVDFIEKAWRDRGPVWGVCAKDGYQFIRKAHYMFGWDWGPAIPDCGIWRDIYIENFNKASIDDIYISQEHVLGKVNLILRTDAEVYDDSHVEFVFSLKDPEGKEVVNSKFRSGKAVINVPDPQIWWPAGYGDHPLYTVNLKLLSNGNEVDERTMKIGLRTLSVRMDDDEWGSSFTYNINGIDIFAKGANYIPEDNVLARCSRERTRALLEQAAAANFNSLRVWGGGIYPESYFYEICDELGLMVWQDFMFACAQYSLDDESFVESIEHEMRDNIKRLRHHASLALWCGNNEMEWLWMDNQTEGRSKEQMDEYLRLFEGIMPPISKEEDPDRLYWPASPSSGGNFDDPNAENRGDVHYWDVWHGLKPFTEYRKFYFRFCSEFGFQSFPGLKTVESFTLPEDRNIFSYVMESHQKNGGANGKILYYLSENFRNPKDFGSLLYVSQLLQAEAIKYRVEHWRRNRGRCMGSIYWQFNDCWPVASWSSIDSFHRWKALHYFARRFYSPVLVSAEENGLNVRIHISNETLMETSGKLEWKLMDKNGNAIDEGKSEAVVGSLESKPVISLDFTDLLHDMDTRRRTFLWYRFIESSGESHESTLLFVPNKYFEYDDPNIMLETIQSDNRVYIRMAASSYAGYVCAESEETDCVFSDNFFSLVPGMPKDIYIESVGQVTGRAPQEIAENIKVISIRDTY